MNESTISEKAIMDQLLQQYKRGTKFLERGDVKPGPVKVWSGRVRSRLVKIYGIESDIVKCFPRPADPVPSENATVILSERMDKLFSFMEGMRTTGLTSFCQYLEGRVFIGHGSSPLWRELKDFLSDRLGLAWDEFNREAVAGFTTFERIAEMLNSALFAFLVMTAEDEYADSSIHARQNVVHEVGLFQGRLGPRKAIILLEDGCEEFSNIIGLSQIKFPKGYIAASFEEIRRVLERENIVKT